VDSRTVKSAQSRRLAAGGLIDRSRLWKFAFDGRQCAGYPGDTLASALLANGVRLVGRSFKYHRPRGILTAGTEEPNALVELRCGSRREPNTRATVAELYDGLEASSQNRWPSLRHDLLSIISLASPFLSAGFYYKTFMWPASFWERLYEPLIRRAAGLGRAAQAHDPDRYEKAYAFCDVLVIGAGAAGLSAALAAGRSGARVILCDEDFRLGGRCLSERRVIAGRSSIEWVGDIERQLRGLLEVRILERTTIFGVYDGHTYAALERVNDHLEEPSPGEPRQRVWEIVAKRCVLAAGALERPLIFGNNDLPGVMLASAVRTYLNRFAVAPGRSAVVFTNNDDAVRTVPDLIAAGISVAAVIDSRTDSSTYVKALAAASGATLHTGAVVRRALGRRELRGVEMRSSAGLIVRLPCDLLAISGGWNPTVHLTSHLGGRPAWNEVLGTFVPERLPPGMAVAGAAAGAFDLLSCLRGGTDAGREAVERCGFSAPSIEPPQVPMESTAMTPLWGTEGSWAKTFVDFQNDVTLRDLELAEREGFKSVEQLKRYTTLGMATDQGKSSNVNAAAFLAKAAASHATPATTTFRPPYIPVAIGALAAYRGGKVFQPTRLTPTHAWAAKQGAVFVEVGLWLRARYYPRAGELDWLDTVNREVRTVRSAVGVCDLSTLGKIDMQGSDAAVFLDRIYCNTFSNLPIGKTRYGLMLREDGFVFDDGTTARLGVDHFLMTTTTANASQVMQHLEFCHQCLWPELDVQIVSVTDQWAQFAVAGPQSREVLRRVVATQVDLSDAALPYLGVMSITLSNGVQGRLFRLSFSGELGYELAVPGRLGIEVMGVLLESGKDLGIAPYGTEALGVLRIEKGHVAGPELNGQTTAGDIGLGRLLSKQKDYIGRLMSARPALQSMDRMMVVGLRPVDQENRFRAGANLLPAGAKAKTGGCEGHVTSVAFSPTLGHWIGLGLLSGGASRQGEVVCAWDPIRNSRIRLSVELPCLIDPKGDRLRG
jgi:methylglutamate dehydrogenase subunit C